MARVDLVEPRGAAVKVKRTGVGGGDADADDGLADLWTCSDWVPVPVLFCRYDGRLLWINRAWRSRWPGPPRGGADSLLDYLAADAVARVLAPPGPEGAGAEYMVSIEGSDGARSPERVRVTHNEVCVSGEQIVCITVVSTPEATAQHSLLELGSRLLGEIAHDLNNELSVLLNYSFVLARQMGGDASHLLTELQNAAWRASGVSQGLVKVGRYFDRRDSPLSVCAVVEPIAPLLRALLSGRRTLELELERTERTCIVPRSRIEQLLMRCVLATTEHVPFELGQSSLLIQVRTVGRDGRAFQSLRVGPVSAVVLQRDAELSSHHESVIMRNIREAVVRCRGVIDSFEPEQGGGVMIELSFPELD